MNKVDAGTEDGRRFAVAYLDTIDALSQFENVVRSSAHTANVNYMPGQNPAISDGFQPG